MIGVALNITIGLSVAVIISSILDVICLYYSLIFKGKNSMKTSKFFFIAMNVFEKITSISIFLLTLSFVVNISVFLLQIYG